MCSIANIFDREFQVHITISSFYPLDCYLTTRYCQNYVIFTKSWKIVWIFHESNPIGGGAELVPRSRWWPGDCKGIIAIWKKVFFLKKEFEIIFISSRIYTTYLCLYIFLFKFRSPLRENPLRQANTQKILENVRKSTNFTFRLMNKNMILIA